MSLRENSQRTDALRRERRDLEAEAAKFATYDRLSNAQEARFVDVQERLSAIRDELEDLREERLANAERFAKQPGAIQPVTEPFNAITRRVDPFDPSGANVEDRAKAALDTFDRDTHLQAPALEAVERSLKDVDQRSKMAEWVTTHGDPAYTSAWLRYIADPVTGPHEFDDREREAWRRARSSSRALVGDVAAQGQVQVPVVIDPAVMLQNSSVVDPMMQLARVETIATDRLKLVTGNGVTGEWLGAQGTQVADATPSDLTQPVVQTYSWDAFITASIEYLEDVRIAAEEIARMLADAAARLHADAWVNGTGANGQPTGFLTTLSNGAQIVTGTSGATNAQTLVLDDAYKLVEALPARYRPNAAFQAALPTVHSFRKLAMGQLSAESVWTQLELANPPALIGHSIHENSSFSKSTATLVSGSSDMICAFASWKDAYCIAQRVGSSLEVVQHMLGSNARPNLTRGYLLRGRAGGLTVQSNAIRVLSL